MRARTAKAAKASSILPGPASRFLPAAFLSKATQPFQKQTVSGRQQVRADCLSSRTFVSTLDYDVEPVASALLGPRRSPKGVPSHLAPHCQEPQRSPKGASCSRWGQRCALNVIRQIILHPACTPVPPTPQRPRHTLIRTLEFGRRSQRKIPTEMPCPRSRALRAKKCPSARSMPALRLSPPGEVSARRFEKPRDQDQFVPSRT